MFSHGGDDAEAAITSRERELTVFVTVDWNRDGLFDHALSDMSRYVKRALTDRSLSGSAPAELMLIEGASAAQLTLTVSGSYNDLSFTGVFSPYNGLSPFYNKPIMGATIRYWIGVETVIGTVWYRQFTGEIRTITPDRASGLVEITALDYVEKLRQPMTLPPWGIADWWFNQGRTAGQLVNTQGIITHALTAGGVSPTPYIPGDESTLWVNGTGSYLPVPGSLGNPRQMTFPHTESTGTDMYAALGEPHPNSPEPDRQPLALSGMENEEGDDLLFHFQSEPTSGYHGGHMFGFTLHTGGSSWWETVPSSPVYEPLRLNVGGGFELNLVLWNKNIKSQLIDTAGVVATVESSWVPVPVTGDHHHIFTYWVLDAFGGGVAVHLEVGVNQNSSGFQSVRASDLPTRTPEDYPNRGRVVVRHKVPMSNIYYAPWFTSLNNATPDTKVHAFQAAPYAASLDRGLNRMSYTPITGGADAWQVITGVAAAEFGSVFWDEEGRFIFWNYQTMLSKADNPVRTLTLDDVSQLKVTNSLDSVRNVYSIDAGRRISSYRMVYESQNDMEFYTPANTTKSFYIPVDDVQAVSAELVVQCNTTGQPALGPQWADWRTRAFVASANTTGSTWEEITGNVDVTATLEKPGLIKVVVSNANSYGIRMTDAAGNIRFRLDGTKILDWPNQVLTWTDEESVDTYGTRNLPLSGDWYQNHANALDMFETLGPRTTKPIPTTDAITIVGDPRLQIGDVIEVRDPEGMGESMRLQIYGIAREWVLDEGLRDTLSIELIQPAGSGLWDSLQYGLWDSTFVWSD